ncbi:uncharacterized protein LOC143810227 [Ranitomeya variabilis]|uniref:uncharacterized protein LOC143810227 n=1 Tax=Ranitomeya variabilis TaxID=490064 RepID=UPI004056111F
MAMTNLFLKCRSCKRNLYPVTRTWAYYQLHTYWADKGLTKPCERSEDKRSITAGNTQLQHSNVDIHFTYQTDLLCNQIPVDLFIWFFSDLSTFSPFSDDMDYTNNEESKVLSAGKASNLHLGTS